MLKKNLFSDHKSNSGGTVWKQNYYSHKPNHQKEPPVYSMLTDLSADPTGSKHNTTNSRVKAKSAVCMLRPKWHLHAAPGPCGICQGGLEPPLGLGVWAVFSTGMPDDLRQLLSTAEAVRKLKPGKGTRFPRGRLTN